MRNYLKVEFMKIKHTSIQKAIFIIPFICFILAGGFSALGGIEVMKLANITAFNHWGVIWLPMSTVLLVGLLHKLEMKSTGYKMIHGLPISQTKVWIAKNITIATLLLAASLILWVLISLFDGIILGLEPNLRFLSALLLSWIAVLWQIPLYLWLAQKVNTFLLMILNFGFSFILGLYATKSQWWAIPWAWILRFQAAMIGVHPNGIPLEENSPLFSYSGFPKAIALAFMMLIGITFLTTRAFSNRKDVVK